MSMKGPCLRAGVPLCLFLSSAMFCIYVCSLASERYNWKRVDSGLRIATQLLQHRVKSRRHDHDGHGVVLTGIPRVFSTAHAFLIDALVFSCGELELDVAKFVCVRRNKKSYVRWAFVSHCRLRSVYHTDIPRDSCTTLNHMVASYSILVRPLSIHLSIDGCRRLHRCIAPHVIYLCCCNTLPYPYLYLIRNIRTVF
ncbi:hypothetical protein BC629DRAFT_1561569 [Irpex lacteus]|nr:hypothetical protein BC629DRAFT_1561569 [Irpex lacteus]